MSASAMTKGARIAIEWHREPEGNPGTLADRIDAALVAAVVAEREACAHLAENNALSDEEFNEVGDMFHQAALAAGSDIAAAIRARSQREGE